MNHEHLNNLPIAMAGSMTDGRCSIAQLVAGADGSSNEAAPTLNGSDCVRLLRAAGHTLPVIICSGNTDGDHDDIFLTIFRYLSHHIQIFRGAYPVQVLNVADSVAMTAQQEKSPNLLATVRVQQRASRAHPHSAPSVAPLCTAHRKASCELFAL